VVRSDRRVEGTGYRLPVTSNYLRRFA